MLKKIKNRYAQQTVFYNERVKVLLNDTAVEKVQQFKSLVGYLTNCGTLNIKIQQRLQTLCSVVNVRVYKN